MQLSDLLRDLFRNKNGATAVEYGLLAAGISVVLVASLATIGTEVNETFTVVGNTLSSTQ